MRGWPNWRPWALPLAVTARTDRLEIAGFWRRLGAFLIDMLLLGLVGFGLGLVLHEQFEAIGAWGLAIGFLITLAYFGTMESRLFDGRTFGKLALDVQVVSTAGRAAQLRQSPAALKPSFIFPTF